MINGGASENKPHETRRYYAMTLDPVHIGTGGSRLGRVDNAIVREPGTNLPKIPGTSISGVCRAYAAMAVQSADDTKKKYMRDVGTSCAGKGANDGEGHCGEPNCEICVTFGFSRGKSNSSFQGLAQFFDARILFFPVYSMIGPIWVTCQEALADIVTSPPKVSPESFKKIGNEYKKPLNFGWLMLNADTDNGGKAESLEALQNVLTLYGPIINSAYLVPDSLFSRIVNDNLEVRTSVAIDPLTGAAEDGALYTYEAIPRATVMWFDVVYNRPEYFRIKKDKMIFPATEDHKKLELVQECVKKGLTLMEHLGLGGMNTRGMGRVEVWWPGKEPRNTVDKEAK